MSHSDHDLDGRIAARGNLRFLTQAEVSPLKPTPRIEVRQVTEDDTGFQIYQLIHFDLTGRTLVSDHTQREDAWRAVKEWLDAGTPILWAASEASA